MYIYIPPIGTQYNIHPSIIEYEVIFAVFMPNLLLNFVFRCNKLSDM